MKDKFWGLKKDEVDRFIQKMETEIQLDLQKHELELVSARKENERLLELINENERNQTSVHSTDYSIGPLAESRLKTFVQIIQSNREQEITVLKEKSKQKMAMYQLEIKKLENEIKTINKIIRSFIHQLDLNPFNQEEDRNSEMEVIQEITLVQQSISENVMKEKEQLPTQTSLKGKIISFQQQEFASQEIDLQDVRKETVHFSSKVSTEEDQILDQILSFKEQYLNGKVAGADLYDKSGNLIIQKNKEISKEIVDKANREGKLAELIVNMKVSGEE